MFLEAVSETNIERVVYLSTSGTVAVSDDLKIPNEILNRHLSC